jgi:hypothetical protein
LPFTDYEYQTDEFDGAAYSYEKFINFKVAVE